MSNSFFLGANSARGFVSFYDDLIDLKTANGVYILKGCPGCGKSSLMKKVASAAESKSIKVERIYCSSDPDSLDGIVLPELGKAIVDGTAPHVVEPSYPLAVERYIDLGKFADISALSPIKDEIIAIKDDYATFFQHIYRFTACAGKIDNELFDISLSGISVEKLHKKAQNIISKEIPKKEGSGKIKKRFLSALSSKGYVTLPVSDDIKAFILEDSFGLGHFFLSPILNTAEKRGFSCIVCYNPLITERIEHLFIPELNLAFITQNKNDAQFEHFHKKIRIDSMIATDTLKENKKRISVLKRVKAELLELSFSLLGKAKNVHDEIENIYNPHIDFDRLYSYADELIYDIIGN